MPYAEDVNYWKTSRTAPSTWLDKAKSEIEAIGGTVVGEAFASDSLGRAAYMLSFELEGDRYRIVWHVLKSKSGDNASAKRQAATALYHDVKNAVVKARFKGARVAFADALVAPDGHTVGELLDEDALASLPRLLQRPALPPGDDAVEADVREVT
jgi:hypothetical protein